MVCILANAASVSEHPGVSPGICSKRCLWLRAASPELQEEEQAASKPPRPARQALKLSKKRRPARLDIASSTQQSLHSLQSETQLSICAHFTSLISTTQNTGSLTYNRQTKGQMYEAAFAEGQIWCVA